MKEITKWDFGETVLVEGQTRPVPNIHNFWYLVERVNELAEEVKTLREKLGEKREDMA